jgi:pseudaminic acid synthase
MPWEWHKPLFERGHELGLTVFSSPFDESAVDLLEDLNAPAYKIASLEIVDLPLIRRVAGTGKPMIMSTGLADADEIAEAVQAARDGGCQHLVLLHCVTGYPAPAADYNLRTIPDMTERFGVMVGLSDHTLDNTTALASVALGAVAVEKHFTLDRRGGGPDDSFSLEPADLSALRLGLDTAWQSLGRVDYRIKPSEAGNLGYRPSIYVSHDVKTGDPVTAENVRTVRPGKGLHCRHLDEVIGRTFLRDVKFGTPLSWSLISGSSKEAP